MADRYWVGVDQDWHDANNWSTISGGGGGAGVPTASDDVFIDGNGFVLCWPTSDIVCNDLTITAAATELVIIDASGVIGGDFSIAGGYFGPTGGPDHVIELQGNYLNTGGTFSVGTGPGADPTVEFSGTAKTYVHDNVGAASYQNVLVSGSYTLSGTRLSVMWISQELHITGTMTINYDNRIDIVGSFETLSGTLEGITPVPFLSTPARVVYHYESTDSVPTGGTISVGYFRLQLEDSTATLNPRTYESSCEVEVEYTVDGQLFTLEGTTRHYFMGGVTVYADDAGVSATWDCATNNAEIWCGGVFDIDSDAFPDGTFTMNWGDGLQVFRRSVDLIFSLTSSTSHLSVDPGEGTIMLYPEGLRSIIVPLGP